MWVKRFVIVHLIVLRNIISSQPVTETKTVRQSRQTIFGECCPCPESRVEGNDFRHEDRLQAYQTSSFVPPSVSYCPCKVTEADSEGSPSIFHPLLLKTIQPKERTQEPKQELKPLLQPEVGLASSVLETLREVTDEEYHEALARDAARSEFDTETSFLDSEAGNAINSVTIVLNPRDDLSDVDDTIPEASHVHETRCIHSPLRRENLVGSAHSITTPRLSKDNLLLKQKPKAFLHKILLDMDNSASNLHERFEAINKNELQSSKLKMHSSLINLPDQKGENNSNNGRNSRLKITLPEYCNDWKSKNELNNSPIFRLAALKNKLRDLTEIKNANRLRNNQQTDLKQNLNIFGHNDGDSVTTLGPKSQSLLDTFIDKQSPTIKNILKLKDVELLTPSKIISKDITTPNIKYLDLKSAGTGNNDDVLKMSRGNEKRIMNGTICDGVDNITDLEEYLPNDPIVAENVARTKVIKNPSENYAITNKGFEMRNSNEGSTVCEIKTLRDESQVPGRFQSNEQDIDESYINYANNNSENNSNEEDDEVEDSLSDTSNYIKQQTSQEEFNTQNENLSHSNENNGCKEKALAMDVDQLKYADKKNESFGSSYQRESSRITSFRDDVLKRLENLKNTIKSKLPDTDFETPKVLDLNSDNDQNIQVTSSEVTSENDLTTQDLQKLSDALLHQDSSLKINGPFLQNMECNTNVNDININNADYVKSINAFDENINLSSESDCTENTTSSENYYDVINSDINSKIHEENEKLQSSTYTSTCDTNSNKKYDEHIDSTLLKDISTKGEMSSQASNTKYNSIRPYINDKHLRNSLPQDVAAQPSRPLGQFIKPLHIPTLEEIRHGITSIIDAGQLEEEESSLGETDPLNESSNLNYVVPSNANLQSKLDKSSCLADFGEYRYRLRPTENARANLPLMSKHTVDSYNAKSTLPKTASLKLFTPESRFGNRVGTLGKPLALDLDKRKLAVKPKSKSASEVLGISIKQVPTLGDIAPWLKTQNLFNPPAIERPILPHQTLSLFANDLYSQADTFKQNLKEGILGNSLSSTTRPRVKSNDYIETMAKKREDMKDKLQALHLDFNDKLASFHERLRDQANLQSVNIPIYKDNGNSLILPRIGSEKGRDAQTLFPGSLVNVERNLSLKPKLLQSQDHMSKNKKNTLLKIPFNTSTDKNNGKITQKQNLETFKEKLFLSAKKPSKQNRVQFYEETKNNLKQSAFTPSRNSKVEISFSTTTTRPLLQKRPALHFPNKGLLRNDDNAELDSKLKGISKTYRSKLKTSGDLNYAPSELKQTRIPLLKDIFKENEPIKNPQSKQDSTPPLNNILNRNNAKLTSLDIQPMISEKQVVSNNVPISAQNPAPSQALILPNAKESSLISNIREAIRARLANTTPASKTDDKVSSPLYTIESPLDNVKTSLDDRPLTENTSYKCSMVCVKDL